jgi:hypothetical protein
MIRTQLLRDIGGFDPSYRFAEERDLSVQLRERGCTSRSSRRSLFRSVPRPERTLAHADPEAPAPPVAQGQARS